MSNNTHVHHSDGTYNVFWVPADTDQRMELKQVTFSGIRGLIDGYIEVVRSPIIPDLGCGCSVVMLVNEDGKLTSLPDNPRVNIYYPAGIVGDAVFAAEGLVDSGDGPEPDLFSLPPEFHDWEGPGSPFPTPKRFGD